MPSEAAELVQRGFDAWNRGDLDTWLEAMHPEIRARGGLVGLTEGTEFDGFEGMRRWWTDFHDAFDVVRLHADEVREVGERVLVLGSVLYRGKASGIEQERPWGWVIWLRDGLAVRLESFDDPADALAVAESWQ